MLTERDLIVISGSRLDCVCLLLLGWMLVFNMRTEWEKSTLLGNTIAIIGLLRWYIEGYGLFT